MQADFGGRLDYLTDDEVDDDEDDDNSSGDDEMTISQ